MDETKAIALTEEKPTSLVFGTNAPEGIITRAQSIAKQVASIVEQGKLYTMIKDRKYVRAEGWTTMAAMLGVFPSTEYSRRIDREEEIAYEAKVVLRHISGAEVGSGEAICSSKERNWIGRDEYTIKSMAQTRAVGKACRLSFSWIMALAGYETVPAEEMSPEPRPIQMPKAKSTEVVNPSTGEVIEFGDSPTVFGDPSVLISEKQVKLLFARMKSVNCPEQELKAVMMAKFSKDHSKDLTRAELNQLLEWLKVYPHVGV